MSRYKESVLSSSFDYKKYLVRRCGKFYPLHWLCLLVSVPLVVRPSGSIKQIGLFVLNAALLQSWVPVRKVYFCFNAVSWYLADTIFFTILFPFVFRWIASATLRGRTLIAGAIALVYLVSLVFIPDEKYHAILYISPFIRLTDFLFGIYLAIAYEGLKTINCLKVRRLPSLFRDFIIVAIVAVLIIESCILPEKIQLMAPVYWPFIACLVLYASLSESSEEDSRFSYKTPGGP